MTTELFLTALALVLVIEGVSYALAPSAMKKMMAEVLGMSDDQLRIMGLVAAAIGVAAVWLIKAFWAT